MRATGNGKTPPRVVTELKKKVDSSSLLAASKATGIGISALHRYLKGVGEPTTATLEKLSAYFEKPVWWLRGESPLSDTALIDNLERIGECLDEISSWKDKRPEDAVNADKIRGLLEHVNNWMIEGTRFNSVKELIASRKKAAGAVDVPIK